MADIKLFSWNVNGIRAVIRKGELQKFLKEKKPDVLALQEIKCKPEQLDLFENDTLKDYEVFWNPAEKAGYSGTAVLVKKDIDVKPQILSETRDLSSDFSETFQTVMDSEGRVLIVKFEKFILVNVYTPNAKPDLSRLKLRHEIWDPEFLKLLQNLEKKFDKPVLACGDFNVAHEEIDLARPKQNHHNAGFTDEEREGAERIVKSGFFDSFRELNPEVQRYTWWSHWGKARENNVGWRIDYFFVSSGLKKNVTSAEIYESQLGSDHCPISLTLKFGE